MTVQPNEVHKLLSRYQLADGYDMVVDLDKSKGVWIHDSAKGEDFLDAFTCFASWPLGFNHPELMEDEFSNAILKVSRNKVANSDLYTTALAEFVEAFGSKVTPEGFSHHRGPGLVISELSAPFALEISMISEGFRPQTAGFPHLQRR